MYKQLGGGDGCHEAMLQRLVKESEEKEVRIKL